MLSQRRLIASAGNGGLRRVVRAEPVGEGTPMRRGRGGPDEKAHHSHEEEDALDEVGPGDGAEAAERLVDHDHQHQDHHTHPEGDGVSRVAGDDVAHRHELREEVVGDRDHQDAVREMREGGRAEAIVEEVPRRHETVLLPEAMERGSEGKIGDDDRHHERDAHDPSEAEAIGLAGISEHGVPAVLRRVEREEENDGAQAASCEIEVAQGLVALRPLRDVTDDEHRNEVEPDERERSRAKRHSAHRSSSSQ